MAFQGLYSWEVGGMPKEDVLELSWADGDSEKDAVDMETATFARVLIAVRILFNVSKGTYIRSLARDIGAACGSAAHLAGLYRTRVGSFSVENAAGFDLLPEFTIESALQNAETLCVAEKRRAQLELDLKARGIPRREWKEAIGSVITYVVTR